jgi:cellobiose transport system substrate-binding protein
LKNRKSLILITLCLALVVTLAACGGNGNTKSSDKEVTLTFWSINGPGLDELIKQYQVDHPNIKIDIQVDDKNRNENLLTVFAAGSGAPDIAITTVDDIPNMKNEDYWANLADFGADQLQGDYLESRWAQGTSADGSFIYGLPTDSGPMAMAYRKDIFEAAGLPSDRESVTNMLSTWEDFYNVGLTIKEKTGKPIATDAFFGSYLPRVQQAGEYTIYDKDGNLIIETNPAVKEAWDFGAKLAKAGLTAKQPDFSADWNVGLNTGDFATVFAPPWMLGIIRENAPDAAGKWDIALMPGGSANWGGSFLLVPKQSKHQKEAYEFIKWVLAPAQQLELYKTNGNFPSTPSVYEDEAFTAKKDAYYSDAPVGEIFAKAAEKVQPFDSINNWAAVNTIIEKFMPRVEAGEDSDTVWNEMVTEVKATISR